MEHAIDETNGGFYGSITNENVADADAPRGLVLNARILWTFSAAYIFTTNKKYLEVADRAYHYLTTHFIDKQYGGFFWSVDKYGKPIETKKQVYGIAFCCYAFSEYYQAGRNLHALKHAKDSFCLIEKYAFDKEKSGYYEAFTRDWQTIDDMRLSAKDANEKKTMNTHLHILEAYANLYSACPEENLKKIIQVLLANFSEHIIAPNEKHLGLFFDENWTLKSTDVSYGHDIEAAWLLVEAANTISDPQWIQRTTHYALQLAMGTREGLDKDDGLWYELVDGKLVKQKHSWPQAEAMVGFFNAWQIGGSKKDLDQSMRSWQFVQQKLVDTKNGEWYWGIKDDDSVMDGYYKAGFWKCPYHSVRACMEIIKRINSVN
jgi:mannobiose 2-epimerase